jgi:glyoxylase-like metal-dependent hydrolase (beta-lactamase superfamily II)
MINEVAYRVYRLGAGLVNWFMIEDGGKFTLVDAGNPNQFDQLPTAVSELGRGMDDIEAIVLTHAHGDHLGSSSRIKDASGAAVHVHRDDVALARGESHREFERHFVRDLRHAHSWKSLVFFLRGGALKAPPVHELVEFDHGETLELPGRPRVIATPGHTDGSSCLDLADRNVLFTGDALVTLNIVTGERSPRIMPGSFNKDSTLSLRSLNELKGSSADLILPGHGEPLSGSVDDAVAAAQQTGAS